MAQYEESGPSPAEVRGDELQKIVEGSDPAIGLKDESIGRRGRDKINAILEKHIPDSLATEKNQYAPFGSYRGYYMSGIGYPVKVDAMNAAVAKALTEIKEEQDAEKEQKKTEETKGGRRRTNRRRKTKRRRKRRKRRKTRKKSKLGGLPAKGEAAKMGEVIYTTHTHSVDGATKPAAAPPNISNPQEGGRRRKRRKTKRTRRRKRTKRYRK